MKTVLQIMLILVISLAVVGVTYGVSQTDWATSQSFGRRPPGQERFRAAGEQPASGERNAAAAPVRERRPGGERHTRALSLAGLGTFGRILLPMALVIGGVGLLRRRLV